MVPSATNVQEQIRHVEELLPFLPLFDVPGRTFIERWEGRQETPNGAITVPYPVYPQDVLRFYWLAGQPYWSDLRYNPKKAVRMLTEEGRIERATLSEIKTMLTYCVRGERFGDGHWAAMLQSGKVLALLRRLRVLRDMLLEQLRETDQDTT